ncbi:MAG: hypothetical protein ABII72_03840 [Parcubacteria group bacterium]
MSQDGNKKNLLQQILGLKGLESKQIVAILLRDGQIEGVNSKAVAFLNWAAVNMMATLAKCGSSEELIGKIWGYYAGSSYSARDINRISPELRDLTREKKMGDEFLMTAHAAMCHLTALRFSQSDSETDSLRS